MAAEPSQKLPRRLPDGDEPYPRGMGPPQDSLSRWRSCRDVDATADPSSVRTYLDDLAGLGMVASEKLYSLQLLALSPGLRCLDVGCGAGPELGWLAELVGRDGAVVGLDRSRELLEVASARHDEPALTLVAGDAGALPFADDDFDAARADRTLQHVDDPCRALREMVRVTRPGGRVVITEFRWGLVAPDLDRAVTDGVLAAMAPDVDRRAWIGHTLADVAGDAGLSHVSADTHDHELEDPDQIARLLNLRWSLPAAVAAGAVTQSAAGAWERELHEQAARGDAFAVMVFLHVAGDV